MISHPFFNSLNKENKILMENFSNWLTTNKNAAESVCIFLANKIGDKELVSDFKKLPEETKLQACLEYLTIGLTAGSVKKQEVRNFLKK